MTGNNTRSEFETFEAAFKHSGSREPVTVSANRVAPGDGENDTVTDRQQRVDGFSQETFSESSVLVVGSGALGCQICRGLVRKGVGRLTICDEDHVEISNLSRQLFYEDDVGRNKAVALAENLVNEGRGRKGRRSRRSRCSSRMRSLGVTSSRGWISRSSRRITTTVA